MNNFIDRFSQLRSAKNASFQCISNAIGISLHGLPQVAAKDPGVEKSE